MEHSVLVTETLGPITRLSLNRPDAYNALSLELMNALLSELDRLAEDESVRVIILKGAGRGFCAGHDLRELTAGDAHLHEQTFETCSRLMLRLSSLPQPVIAQVHGVATAAGCQLTASCDLAVAAEDARFATPGVNIGLFCSTPMVALTRNLAPKHALEMLYTGDLVGAPRAYEMGLINRCVAADALEDETLALAEKLASKSRAILALGKEAFHHQQGLSPAEAYAHCAEVMSCNFRHPDAREGVDAFLAKRPPQWPTQS